MTRQVRKDISRFSCATFAFASALTLNEGLANAQTPREENRVVAAVTLQTLTPRVSGARLTFSFNGSEVTSYGLLPVARPPQPSSFSFTVPSDSAGATAHFRFYPMLRRRSHTTQISYSLRYEVGSASSSVSGTTSQTSTAAPVGRRSVLGTPLEFQIPLAVGTTTITFPTSNPDGANNLNATGLIQLVSATYTPSPPPEPPPVIQPPACTITCPPNHVLNSTSCSCNIIIPITPRVVAPPVQRPVDLPLGSRISVSANGFYSPDYLGGSLDVNLTRRLRPNLGLSFGAGTLFVNSDAASANHVAGMYVASPHVSFGVRANVRSVILDARLLLGANIQGVSETSPNATTQTNLGLFAGVSGSLTSRLVYANLTASNSPLIPLHLQVGYPSIPSWVRNQKIRAGVDASLIRPTVIDSRTLNLDLGVLLGASASVPLVQIGSTTPALNLMGGVRVGTTDLYFGAGLSVNTN
jgi:hypothetical protein